MRTRTAIAAGIVALGAGAPAAAMAAPADGQWILDARLRSESVSQDGLPKDAEALTLRTRLGYETPAWKGLRALVEGEDVAALVGDYNSTLNGKTAYPVVPDPRTDQLNRAQVSWTGSDASVVVGRQRIILGNARFIGNVGFRQTEQTFDAALAQLRPLAGVTVTYGYIGRVHRVFTDRSPQGQWRSDSHILQAEARVPGGTLTGYAYLLAFANAAAQSTETWGVRYAGAHRLTSALSATIEAEAARQTDYRNNPARLDLGYFDLGLGLKSTTAWGALAVEQLGGDGRHAFQTPLATLHAFQGWADVFLVTPPYGVRDVSLSAGTTAPISLAGLSVKLLAAGHDFTDDRGGRRYGRELDASAEAPISPHLGAELALARFDGTSAGFPDRTKVWATLDLKY
ncbi:MAG: hypothetical protein KGO51_15695 [Alphaproteobacteria bacterium]|nr:hypothetical protein [Alphaproteobacteria bacterium]